MKSLWYRLSLPLKFALPVTLLCLLCAFGVLGATSWAHQQILQTRTQGLGEALVSRLAANAARPLLDNDAVHVQAVVGEYSRAPVVQRAAIFDLQQKLIAAAGDAASDAASDESIDAQEFSATVHWQDAAIGRAVLSLRADGGASAHTPLLNLRDLLTLAVLLAVIAGACAFWLGLRFEALLLDLTRKLSGETLPLAYPDTDTLGHLLHHPVPPMLEAEPVPVPRNGATFLHIYVPSEITADCERALRHLRAVSKLYRGEITITRAAGMTVRFAADDEMEGPFRALCCAQLLRKLSEPHVLRLALSPLASTDDGDTWREQQLIRQLNQACVDVARDNDIAIDAQMQRHPAINARCELEMREEFWIVKALKSPYDTLLERQFTTLKSQLETVSADTVSHTA